MSNTNHSITNLKAINVKVKNYAIFWPGRTKDKSNDNAFLYLQSIISCITNDPVIVDSVILTGCKGKMVGVERECFERCPEKCCRAGQLECLMICLNLSWQLLLDDSEAVLFITTVWCDVTPDPCLQHWWLHPWLGDSPSPPLTGAGATIPSQTQVID